MIQHTRGTQELKGRIWIVYKLSVIVNEQGLHIVKNKAKLIRTLHSIQARSILRGEVGSQTGQGGGVHNFADLETDRQKGYKIVLSLGKIRQFIR